MQRVDPTRGDTDEDLLLADFEEDGALFLAQGDVSQDVDGIADAVVETAHAAGNPGNGENRDQDEQQCKRDLCESARA